MAIRSQVLNRYGLFCNDLQLCAIEPIIHIERTSGIKMLYVFVDIKIDSLHFVETLKHNFLDKDDFPQQPRLALFR